MTVKAKSNPKREPQRTRSDYHVEAIERGLDILRLFGSERPTLSLVEIGRLLHAVPSTTLRIVNTLEDMGFLEALPNSTAYRAGPSALKLGHAYITGSDIRAAAAAPLSRLRDAGGESVSLGVLVDEWVYFIDHVRTAEPMSVEVPVGARHSLASTAAGKSMLAFMRPGDAAAALSNAKRSRDDLRKDLGLAKIKGYAMQDEEFAAGTRSIAAPVFDRHQRPVGAVSVAVAVGRYELAELERQFSPLVIGCAAEISARLRTSRHLPDPASTELPSEPELGLEPGVADARSRYHVEALARGLMALRAFSGTRPRVSLTELAKRTGSLMPTAFRVMSTLVSLGYATVDETDSRYELTPKVLELGYEGLSWLSFSDFVAPRLQRFQEETHLNIFLSVLTGDAAVDILSLVRPGSLSTLGRRYPLYCTPAGKVLLSFMEPDARRAILSQVELSKRAPKTLTDPDALEAEIARVRARGYSVSMDEYLPGVRGVGVPVLGADGTCIAAVACTVPGAMSRSTSEWDLMIRQAVDLSQDLSGRVAARFN